MDDAVAFETDDNADATGTVALMAVPICDDSMNKVLHGQYRQENE